MALSSRERLRPGHASLEQLLAGARVLGDGLIGELKDATTLEVAGLCDAIAPAEALGRLAEHLAQLVRSPGVCESLDSLGVGVLRRREAILREAQVANEVVERLLGDSPVALLTGQQPRVEVGAGEKRVVVEHLLEVGDEPLRVHGVTVKAAAELVDHPSCRHSVQRQARHGEGVVRAGPCVHTEEELQRRRGRELGCPAESAPHGIERGAKRRHGAREKTRRQRLGRARALARLADRVHEPAGLLFEVATAVAIGLRDRLEHLAEARHAMPRLWREVRAAPERTPIRGQEDGHRPTAVAGESDDRVHVEPVDVRPLLPVDFHRDEPLVHERRGLVVLEGLVLHDVAPVAGGVPDGEEDRLVLLARAFECLLTPRVPVDRVRGVLEEVRARLVG